MTKKPEKPKGSSGPMAIGGGRTTWQVIPFPIDKEERESLFAKLFVESFGRWVAGESEPSLAPFSALEKNEENDLDFNVQSSEGLKLLELAEFAPLQTHGPTFEQAPKAIDPKEKAPLTLRLIQDKSQHQGGADRILLLYTTEHGFWLDDITIERLRRLLSVAPPNFGRVYYLSAHSLDEGSTSEIYPGAPHFTWGKLSDEQLDKVRVMLPHPDQMVRRRVLEGTISARWGSNVLEVPFKLDVPDVSPLRR